MILFYLYIFSRMRFTDNQTAVRQKTDPALFAVFSTLSFRKSCVLRIVENTPDSLKDFIPSQAIYRKFLHYSFDPKKLNYFRSELNILKFRIYGFINIMRHMYSVVIFGKHSYSFHAVSFGYTLR